MDTYFLKNEDVPRFYGRIAQDYELYLPVKINPELSRRIDSPVKLKCDYSFHLPTEDYALKPYAEPLDKNFVFNDYRCLEPVRAYLAHFKEEACDYFSETGPEREKPLALAGVKNCDLFALKILDFVFLGGEEEDPLYKKRRETLLLISGDCPGFKEACFCRAFEINPHPSEGFDFNFSPLNNGFLVDVASEKARRIADGLSAIFTPASVGQLSGRAGKREAVIKRMEEHLRPHQIPTKDTLRDIVLSGYNSPLWKEQMRTCVECGGCIFICDTCHCFLLADEPAENNSKRIRVWDGCLLKNFSRVAGGANPLKMRYMRLRNRYLKKFDFFVENLGLQACCGCGRCIEVCPGKIDIRYILRKLHEEKYLPAS